MKNRGESSVTQFLVLLISALMFCRAQAHDAGLSTATLQVESDRVDALLIFSFADFGQIVNHREGTAKSTNEISEPTPAELDTLARQSLEVRFDDRPVSPDEVQCHFESTDNARIRLSYSGRPQSNLFVRSTWLTRLPAGHRQFISIQSSNGAVLAERLLTAADDSITVRLDATAPGESKANSFADFLVMGVKHIWTGYDHLLFLFGLLIVTRSFGSSVKVITCFTIAHSITLAVATLSRVEFSSRIVEPLIAASIVYVGVENLWRGGEPKGRGWLAFGFGLIHGFGFASVLRELGVAERPGGIALPLFSFNLGVELGQVAVAAIVLPLIWKLRTRPQFVARWVPACSIAIVLLGGYWFVQRVAGFDFSGANLPH